MRIHFGHARIILSHLLVQKHLHASPGRRSFARLDLTEELPDASGFDRGRQSNKGAAGHLLAEDRARAEGADHFIVAHVNHPQITIECAAVMRDVADHVRVDRGDRDIDDFDSSSEPLAQ